MVSRITPSHSFLKNRHPLKLAVVSFLTILLLTTLNSSVALAKKGGSPKLPKGQVELLTNDQKFNKKKMVHLDFSSVSCCKILSSEYQNTAGVRFENDIPKGWATYQANGFANHLSGSPMMPGAPTGITGTRIVLSQNTKEIGMYLQAGSPFDYNDSRPSKSITLRVYDAKENKIFEKTTDTCLGKASSCKPQFIGVKSAIPRIRTLEVIINEPYNWSIDDLKWEPQRKITPSPTVSPTPFPTIYPSPIPLPTIYPSIYPSLIPLPTLGPTVYPSPIPLPTSSPLPTGYPSPLPTIIPLPTIYPTTNPSPIPLPTLGPTTYPNPIPIITPTPQSTTLPLS